MRAEAGFEAGLCSRTSEVHARGSDDCSFHQSHQGTFFCFPRCVVLSRFTFHACSPGSILIPLLRGFLIPLGPSLKNRLLTLSPPMLAFSSRRYNASFLFRLQNCFLRSQRRNKEEENPQQSRLYHWIPLMGPPSHRFYCVVTKGTMLKGHEGS